jgi:ABC-type Na+ efflux pump permease subunit
MWAIAKKDMKAIGANLQVWLPMLILPALLGVVLPGVIIGLTAFMSMDSPDMQEMAAWVSKINLGPISAKLAAMTSLNQQIAFVVANYMLAPFFVLIPLMTASVVSADSFAGEKERGTFETLLFAPVDLKSLFAGKFLASFIPAVGLSLASFVLCGITVNALGWKLFRGIFFPQLNWLPMILLVMPLLSAGAVLANVFISAKVSSFQAAYQMGGVLVLPFLLLLVGQMSGVLVLGTGALLAIAAVLAVIDAILLQLLLKNLNRTALFESQVR